MLEVSVAFIAATVVMVPVVALLRRHQVLDVPNLRSSHAVAVPRGGGLGLLAGVLAGLLAALLAPPDGSAALSGTATAVVALGVTLFAVLGLVDDLRRTGAASRLLLQVAIGVGISTVIATGTSSSWNASLVAVVGALWLVSYVNAFNFMDGINAISAVSALLAACWFAGLATHDSEPLAYAASWALAGACLAFLPWNAPRARVFLGDVGSYGVGALVAVLAMLTAVREHDLWWGLAPLVIYLVDTSGTLVHRAVRREPLLEAHRSHVYQRLLDHGLSHLAVTAVVLLAGVLICLATLALPDPAAILVAAVVSSAYLCLPVLLGNRDPEVPA